MQKILSLCFPTYNRGWCMKEQIERLMKCPKETLAKMEIIISDNCSTDDTQQIVSEAITKGFPAIYHRNDENLGMDGNFVTCFRMARGKYVWLLGDDDIILIDALVQIVDKLSSQAEYGLVHIDQLHRIDSKDLFVEFHDPDVFCRTISYYTTFISANIARTEYVPDIEFENYMGTWFTLMPLYIKSLLNNKSNLLANFNVFERPKDFARNGGYNFFQVFVTNYLGIWKEFLDEGKIKHITFEYIKKDIFVNITAQFIIKLLFLNQMRNQFRVDGAWKILLSHYGNEFYFYRVLIKRILRVIIRKYLK